MEQGQLRYLALGLGTALTALAITLDKLPEEAIAAVIGAIFIVAGADQIKPRSDYPIY